MSRAVIAGALAILLTASAPAASADLGLVTETLEILRTRHWNPNLDLPAVIRSGVDGLRRDLRRAGIDPGTVQDVPAGLDRAGAMSAFGDRLDQAVQLAAGKLTERQLLHGGLRTMLNAVGSSHTYFLDPQERARRDAALRGEAFGGIGIRLARQRGEIVSVSRGGPADRMGVLKGDILLRVDNVPVEGLDAFEIVPMIRGESGTPVMLTVRRGARELQFTITRALVPPQPLIEARVLDGGIGYINVLGFSANTQGMMRLEMQRILSAQPRGLIVDLREHGGGADAPTRDFLSMFVPAGSLVGHDIFRDGIRRPLTTEGTPIVPGFPVVVLVGPGTVSAGEMTTAALKERRGAVIVGTRTAGELEVFMLFGLSDGSGVYVSVRRTLTGDGVDVEGRGYPPDIEVPHDPESDRDVQLDRAIQVLRERLSGRLRRAA